MLFPQLGSFLRAYLILEILDLLLEVCILMLNAIASIGQSFEIFLEFYDLVYECLLLIIILGEGLGLIFARLGFVTVHSQLFQID